MLRFAEQLGSLLTRSLHSALLLVLTGAGTEDVEFNLRWSPAYRIHCATTATSAWEHSSSLPAPKCCLQISYRTFPHAIHHHYYFYYYYYFYSCVLCFYSIPGRAVISVFCCGLQGQPLVQHLHRDRPQPSAELLSGAAPVHGMHACVSA